MSLRHRQTTRRGEESPHEIEEREESDPSPEEEADPSSEEEGVSESKESRGTSRLLLATLILLSLSISPTGLNSASLAWLQRTTFFICVLFLVPYLQYTQTSVNRLIDNHFASFFMTARVIWARHLFSKPTISHILISILCQTVSARFFLNVPQFDARPRH
jgi:hypothetical protein